jgi:hypothetical protein
MSRNRRSKASCAITLNFVRHWSNLGVRLNVRGQRRVAGRRSSEVVYVNGRGYPTTAALRLFFMLVSAPTGGALLPFQIRRF